MTDVSVQLMFQDGEARSAVERYVGLVPDSRIDEVTGDDGPGQVIRFTLAGRGFVAFDSPIQHGFDFTPSTSIVLTLDSTDAVDAAFAGLSEGGGVLMPVGDHGFNPHFGWCTDRHGVSWQVMVAT